MGKVEAINTDADRHLRQGEGEGRDLQDGSFSFPTSIIPNDGIINGVDATDDVETVPADNANQESIQQLGENSLEDDGILTLMTGKLVDKLKNGKVDEVSSLVKEVVARGIDDEGIGKLLAELITLLVDLSWDENKKSTSSKSGKSSKKSSDDPPITTTQATNPVTTTPVPPATTTTEATGCTLSRLLEDCGSTEDCCPCKCIWISVILSCYFLIKFFI